MIIKIIINKLFGLYSYELDFNHNNISIIYGPNGYGKTTILKIIDAVFKKQFELLIDIPFNYISFMMEDNKTLKITNNCIKIKPYSFLFELIINNKPIDHFKYEFSLDDKNLLRVLQRLPIEIGEKGKIFWLPEDREIKIEELIKRLPEHFLERYKISPDIPEKFKVFFDSLKVHYIKAQRLYEIKQKKSNKYDDVIVQEEVVDNYSNELKSLLNDKLSEYGNLSQQLDQTFPNRLVDQTKSKKKEYSKIEDAKKILIDLQEKQKHYIDLGIFTKTDQIMNITEIEESILNMLNVYIPDTMKKLKVFDEFSKKIEIFCTIINELFLNKKSKISKEKGLYFENDLNVELKSSQLSSGEKNELIMLYELLWKTSSNTLVLIDEPELSLHIKWLGRFISDLNKISNLIGFNCILATHSPDITQGRNEIMIPLENFKDGK